MSDNQCEQCGQFVSELLNSNPDGYDEYMICPECFMGES